MYLVNKSGKTVEVDDLEQCKRLIKQGFKKANKSQIKEFVYNLPHNVKKRIHENDIFFLPAAQVQDGYGESQRYLISSLKKKDIYLNTSYRNQNIGILYSYPYKVDFLKTPCKVIFTMFETDEIPDDWKKPLSKADVIIVPAKFLVPVFKNAGFDVEVLPLGYDDSIFKFEPKPVKKDNTFTFIHYDAFKYRKGYDLVIEAFNHAFSKDDNVRLVLKTTRDSIIDNRVKIPVKSLVRDNPQIQVISNRLTHEELYDLLRSADCGVFPSRGEGFGLPPLELMGTGTTSIIPNVHGFSEYFDSKYFYEVKVSKKIPAIYESLKNKEVGNMWLVDVWDLAEKMRYAFEHRDETYQRGIAGAEYVKGKYTYDVFAEKFKDLYQKTIKPISETKLLLKKTFDIIILTHNAIEYTKKCIESVQKNTKVSFSIIIVDNDSSDGTAEYLYSISKDSNITVIKNNENRGVAGGRNQGLQFSKADYIVFLDNDTEVGKDWDTEILKTFQKDRRIGVIGKTGEEIESLNPLIFANSVEAGNSGVYAVDVVPGYLQVFPRTLLSLVGRLNDNMGKFWHEDLDFCMRARKYGFKVVVNTHIPIVHYQHKSVKTTGQVTDDEIKEHYPGFDDKAVALERRLAADNELTIYRSVHDDCHESFCLLADRMTETLRDNGVVVYRKNHIHSPEISFDICKCFEMKHVGRRFITLHLENNIAPRSWLEQSKYVDYVFCASPHAYYGLKDSGFDESKLINYSLDGYDDDQFTVDGPIREDFYDDYFKFLFVGASQPRKGLKFALEAFARTFTIEDKVVFIIKDYNYGQKTITEKMVKDLREQYPKSARVIYLYEDWPTELLAKTFRAVARNGAYIHPHRAECFGLPIMEALACGCRVGTTNFGGPKYLYDKNIVDYFSYTLDPSTFHNWQGEPYYQNDESPLWATPSINDIAAYMKKVFSESWDENEAKKRAIFVKSRYNYKDRAKNTFNIIKEKVKNEIY